MNTDYFYDLRNWVKKSFIFWLIWSVYCGVTIVNCYQTGNTEPINLSILAGLILMFWGIIGDLKLCWFVDKKINAKGKKI